MGKIPPRILVAYASRAGTTLSIAEAIAETLSTKGAQVEVLPVKEVRSLTPYQAVVAGSAIRGAKWLPEGLRFVEANREELSQKPFAAFMVCITLAMKNGEQYRDRIKDWMDPVRQLVQPVSEGMFAGMLDFDRIPFSWNRLKMQASVAAGIFPPGDHRDWEAIRLWAEKIYPLLAAPIKGQTQ